MGVCCSCCFSLFFILALVLTSRGASGATFTFVNKCEQTVWPGILANAGSAVLETTGFELPKNTLRTLQAPTGWSGRFWGRTGCTFDEIGSGSGSLSSACATGDCGSGKVTCDGNGAATPVTLAEITLGSGGQDFYDVSLVDGYNLPMVLEASGGSVGACASTGCVTDLNRQCPQELRLGGGDGCKSACVAFNTPEYCCSGAYGSPVTCKASVYSNMFKLACPTAYSYAYDDATSTFTCTGADYTITFCPSSPSQKSSRDTAPATATPEQPGQENAGEGAGTGAATGTGPLPGAGVVGESVHAAGSGSGSEVDSGSQTMADGSWLAGLAMGDSARPASLTALQFVALFSLIFSLVYL